jgi:protein arginine kinase
MIQAILTHQMPPWLSSRGPEQDVVLSSRVRLARNLSHHQFPWRASTFERTQVFEETVAAFSASVGCRSFGVAAFGNIDKNQQDMLVEECLASPELAAAEGDRGIVYHETRRISAMINEEDHVRFIGLDSGLGFTEMWSELDALDSEIGTHLDYAFDNALGYLTSRPANAGSALRLSALLHLPGLALTRALDGVLQGASRMGIATRKFLGENASVAGNLFVLHCGAAMGCGEAETVDNAATVIRQVAQFERKARERILSEARTELSDKIHRSWGILCNAKVLTVDEFLNLGSALRLGIECNLFDKCTIDDINRLMLFVQPAHCAACFGTAQTGDESRQARARLVQTFLSRNAKEG